MNDLTSNMPLNDTSVGTSIELWLMTQTSVEPTDAVYWAAHRLTPPSEWVKARSVEHLAVLISTCIQRDNNACQIYGGRDRSGRSVSVIGLQPARKPPAAGWAVNVTTEEGWHGDVRRHDYPHNNYDSFGALTAAEISWAWVATGTIPAGLIVRRRAR